MSSKEFLEELKREFSGAITKVEDRLPHGLLCAEFNSDAAVSVFSRCARGPQGKFDFLEDLTACDTDEDIVLIYNLYSTALNQRVFLKTALSRESPKIATAVPFWRGARFYEYEAAEMFGVRFKNNESTGPFLLAEGWVGHPMRKDYVYPESFGEIAHRREKSLLNHAQEKEA